MQADQFEDGKFTHSSGKRYQGVIIGEETPSDESGIKGETNKLTTQRLANLKSHKSHGIKLLEQQCMSHQQKPLGNQEGSIKEQNYAEQQTYTEGQELEYDGEKEDLQ